MELLAILSFYFCYMSKSFRRFSEKARMIICIQIFAHSSSLLVEIIFQLIDMVREDDVVDDRDEYVANL